MLSYRKLQIHLQNLQIELISAQDVIKHLKELDSNSGSVLYTYHGKKMSKMEIQDDLHSVLELEQKLISDIMELTLLVGVEEANE